MIEDIKIYGRSLNIQSLDFFGNFSKSPDGRFIIAWDDTDKKSGIGGFREQGMGEFLLIDRSAPILKRKLQRPNAGKVANNGIFIIGNYPTFDPKLQIILAIR
ncbi:MAG: hypothetical protein M1269_01920 [Chloroflexi bacterium]|nr:hypothetical protein [Chloroflexota bacterium]